MTGPFTQDAPARRTVRAGAADKSAAAGTGTGAKISVELIAPADLADHLAAWRDLVARAAEPNVFLEPDVLLPALAAFGGDDVEVALAWRHYNLAGENIASKLVALMPVATDRGRYGPVMPPAIAWRHPYCVVGVPLVDRAQPVPALAALFARIAEDTALPPILLLPFMRAKGAVARAIRTACATDLREIVELRRWQRAELRCGTDPDTYLHETLSRRRRSMLDRYRRRLAEEGRLEFVTYDRPSTIVPAFEEFLALETSGWKGAAGSAIAARSADQRFFVDAVSRLAGRSACRIDALRLDDRPLAIVVSIVSAGILYTWKIAYDEAFARRSPGSLLLVELTRNLLADDRLVAADSLSDPGSSLIEPLWHERLEMADMMVNLRAGPLRFDMAQRLERLREAARRQVARLRG
ncbi:MAG: GNAT family N-acetyltransferase [Hyphomicrobiales bacterium]|nr:GNAT family N-acetyltransferase [Hyphomicrobiales bacterium]